MKKITGFYSNLAGVVKEDSRIEATRRAILAEDIIECTSLTDICKVFSSHFMLTASLEQKRRMKNLGIYTRESLQKYLEDKGWNITVARKTALDISHGKWNIGNAAAKLPPDLSASLTSEEHELFCGTRFIPTLEHAQFFISRYLAPECHSIKTAPDSLLDSYSVVLGGLTPTSVHLLYTNTANRAKLDMLISSLADDAANAGIKISSYTQDEAVNLDFTTYSTGGEDELMFVNCGENPSPVLAEVAMRTRAVIIAYCTVDGHSEAHLISPEDLCKISGMHHEDFESVGYLFDPGLGEEAELMVFFTNYAHTLIALKRKEYRYENDEY